MRFDDWESYSRPRAAKGGIKAASQRGSFGETWWAKRWIAVLESFNIGGRLQRGRSYARRGQVLSIDVQKGKVEATVQGSRAEPYRVQIKVRPISAAEWKRLAEDLGTQAIFAAKLLAGEMPQDIEQAFTAAGLSLFPQKAADMSTDCSCPDMSNPCKHIAAVYYLMGEAFDRDPFLIFRLRGMDREDFVQALGSTGEVAEPEKTEPPPADPAQFWAAKPLPAPDMTPPSSVAALPRRLGNLQFWRGDLPLHKSLESIYESASKRTEELLLD
jgi:uncharacterized Zn finger protein